WMAERDLRQLLKHRHTLVQMRTRVKNQLQHIALNQGWQKKRTLWTESGQQWLRKLELEPWTSRRRDDLLEMLKEMNQRIAQLNTAVEQAAEQRPEAAVLMSHPRVGPSLALVTPLTPADVKRFVPGQTDPSLLCAI